MGGRSEAQSEEKVAEQVDLIAASWEWHQEYLSPFVAMQNNTCVES